MAGAFLSATVTRTSLFSEHDPRYGFVECSYELRLELGGSFSSLSAIGPRPYLTTITALSPSTLPLDWAPSICRLSSVFRLALTGTVWYRLSDFA